MYKEAFVLLACLALLLCGAGLFIVYTMPVYPLLRVALLGAIVLSFFTTGLIGLVFNQQNK